MVCKYGRLRNRLREVVRCSRALAALHATISATLKDILKTPSNARLPAARPNVKWSKISINGVPTGMSNKHAAYTPAECHDALTSINPLYTQLTVTQQPSWVHTPTSYHEGAISSLSVAFEDLDGSNLETMLAEQYLYINGTRVTMKKWKHHPPNHKDNTKNPATQHTTDGDSSPEDDEEEVATLLTQLPTAVNTPLPAPCKLTKPTTSQSLFDHTATRYVLDLSGFQFGYTTTPPSQHSFRFSDPLPAPEKRPPNPPRNVQGGRK
jgi:hypothetical protein